MKRLALCFALISLLIMGSAMAATEEAESTAIDNGLAWLAGVQTISGPEGYWSYGSDGTLAATASAALAFIEEGYLPGDASIYDDVITRAVTYIFNRAAVAGGFGVETAGYTRYAEDYSNDGPPYDGNNEAIYFNPGNANRSVYTTGICTPVVYALGEALGVNTVIGIGSAAISSKTYAQAMQDIVDWFSWGQVEPNRGNYRGGWRYDANYSSSDNSTAQWGSLPLLYAQAWGLGVPDYVYVELEMWVNYIQNNSSGGSGYDSPTSMVNISKTGGLLLELAAIGANATDPRVLAAVNYINSRWNTSISGWDGNFNNAYAMWAVYKGLQVYGYLIELNCPTLLDPIPIGEGIPAAPGGFTICSETDPQISAPGDWYSHYCDYLVGIQNVSGSWSGAGNWTGALATGWYINILNAVPIPPPVEIVDLDIKPTSCPNPLNPGAKGVLPVAILGTADFDVSEIDPTTLLLEGVSPLRWAYQDVSTPVDMNGGALTMKMPEKRNDDCICGTDGPDGYMDLTLKFDMQEVIAALEPFTRREGRYLEITGELLTGRELEGKDCVVILFESESLQSKDVTTLYEPRPNPFNPVTQIPYSLGTELHVTLSVYDVAGRLVERLVDEVQSPGQHIVEWNAGNLASGTYFCRLKAGDKINIQRVVLLK